MGAVAYLRPVEPQHKDTEPPDPGGTTIVCPDCDGEQFKIREIDSAWCYFCSKCGCEIAQAVTDEPPAE